MMLATSLLTATQAAVSVFSPTRNTCMKKVAKSRFRYEPYSARVLPASCMPISPPAAATAAACVPSFAAAMSQAMPVAPAAVAVQPVAVAAAPVIAVAAPASPIPAAVAPRVGGPRFAIVDFKHESFTFLAPFRIAAGELVVVDGDRGENIGIVREIVADKPLYNVTNTVLRRANDKDREALAAQRMREAAAVRTTQALADGLSLRATIEDAEYQFDLNKLTIFVRRASKNAFVDFRKLQRGLFREFRCRIWCAYMDEVEEAEAGPRSR